MFKPTEIGLYDVAGNAWEWMDNVYADPPDDQTDGVPRIVKSAQELPGTGPLTLRGGSWINVREDASCSYRFRLVPDYWSHNVGVRVVLSLAKKRSVKPEP